jgi:hypothetical protein
MTVKLRKGGAVIASSETSTTKSINLCQQRSLRKQRPVQPDKYASIALASDIAFSGPVRHTLCHTLPSSQLAGFFIEKKWKSQKRKEVLALIKESGDS